MGPGGVGQPLHQLDRGTPQVAGDEGRFQGRRHGQHPLDLRTGDLPVPDQLGHGRQEALDLPSAAARQERHQGPGGVQARGGEEGLAVALGNHQIHQGISQEAGVHRQAPEQRWLEVEEAVEGVQSAPQHRDTALLPGPDLGADVLVQAYARHALAQGLGEAQVEAGVVDE